jgi:hypothetical protein
MTISAVRALTFDVFGTVVDWRSSVIAQVEAVATAAGVTGDWAAFADEWRYDGYIAGIGRVVRGEAPMGTASSRGPIPSPASPACAPATSSPRCRTATSRYS